MLAQLSQELSTYQANFESLLGSSEGKFVLIYQDRILGTFDNQMDAITRGYDEFGNVPFLVKLVTEVDVPLSFVSNLLAV